MEMNRAEQAAVDGVACDLLDSRGRLVITPNALTCDGQRNVPADLQPGETLEAFLRRHVPGIESGAWTVMIGGAMVPRAMWKRTWPKHGQLIACRASVGKQVVQLVAMAALTWFTMGAGLALWAGTGAMASVIGMGTFVAGSMLINKVLGPKVPKMGEAAAARQVHSLSSRRNTKRPHEPLPTLWGEMRVLPDLASDSYTWFEGENQYLSTILLGGVNVHSAADLAIGDTPITSFEEVSTFFNGFSGMPSQDVPLYGNVDGIAGGELENDGGWVARTSSPGTVTLQFDIEGQLYDVDNKGNTLVNSVPLFIETRPVGGGAWQAALSTTLTNATADVVRRTFTVPVALGQHEARVRLGKPTYDEGEGKDLCKFAWNVLKSIQPDATDYSGWGRIGIKIKATGQISGSLDTLRATYRARPLPVWNGTEWITATTRAEGLSNCGAILLQTLRGVYAPDENGVPRLQFGFGMSDEQIDIEGLKAFMLHCTARGYNYDRWITGSMSLGQFCDEVALAGMGEFSWTDGGRPTAVFVSSGQPLSGVVNMANMLKGSFSVAYNLANAADGIEYQYVDRDRNWETQTLRVAAPGVTTMLSPARITSEGVTSEAHAAVLARYHLAQSLYQYKTIDFGADIEHLAYRRLSVLSVSHDLTQWGFGGRVMHAERDGDKVVLQLDEPVPPMPQAYVGLRVPGARDYRVFQVEALEAESEWVTLVGAWPAGVKFPGADLDNPAHDTLWCYDFKATPGYRVRVVGMQPEADLKGAQVTCVPEGPEFWDYVLNGTYTPAPNQSSLPQLGRPKVSNLRITEKVNVQGDTEWYSLGLVWDVEGDYDHAQVWAGRDGSELRLVDGSAVGSRAEFRIDGAGEWLVEVRPFNASGLVGQSATVLYITSMTQLPPRNVDDFVVQSVAGGLRRFAWQYVGDRPPAFAGVQIRYLPGDVQLSVADWDGMQPLGEADDVYRAQFETTRPQAGLWTFGCRAIDTSGQLANGVVRFVANLGDSFEQVQQPDLTPPPAVTGLSAIGMLSNVQVNWDAAIYEQGHGHARTIIYGAQGADATFAQAQQVAEAFGGPVSFGSEPATTWKLWAKHQSVDGVLSVSAGQPVTVTTGQDVEKLLEVLDGQITESQLYQDLAKEIELISGGGIGSVNARLLAEALERAQEVAAEAQARAQAVALEAQARAQDIGAEAQARAADVAAEAAARQAALAQVAADLQAASAALQGNIDAVNAQVADIIGAGDYDPGKSYDAGQLVKQQGKLYRSKVAVPAGNPPPAAAYWVLVGDYASIGEAVAAHAAALAEHAVRIGQTEQGLTAEVTARSTLAAQLRGSYTGADVSQVTSGLVWSERQARVSGDSANASAIQAVSVRMPAGAGVVAAAADVVAEQQARIAGDSANASAIQTVTARMPTGMGVLATGASVTDEATARASADSALGSRASLIETRLPVGTGQLATSAQVVTEQQARVAGDNANASLIQGVRTDLTSTQGTVAGQGSAIGGLQSSVTSINGALTSQAGSITQLQASVGAASEGLKAMNALGSESEWLIYSSGAVSRTTKAVADAAAGSVLVVGGNTGGNDMHWLHHSATLPLDETRLYKITARFRRTAGAGGLYIGIAARNADKSRFVSSANVETTSPSGAHYAVSNATPALNEWQTVERYFRGRSAGGMGGGGTIASPWIFANKAAHLSLMILANYNANSGTQEFDFVTLEDVTGAEKVAADLTAEATVRASADGALASRATALEARMPVGSGQLATAAALQSLDGRVTAAEGVNTSQGTALTNLQNSVTGLQSSKADSSALASLQSTVTGQGSALSSQGGQITSLSNSVSTVDELLTVADTRNVNSPPSYYWNNYKRRTVREFKGRGVIGAPGASSYGILETTVKWNDSSGGPIIQVFSTDNSLDQNTRYSTGLETWSAWKNDVRDLQVVVNAKAESSAVQALTSRVTAAEGVNTSQGTALTNLQNSITGLQSGKAEASALAALQSSVTQQGGALTSQGSSITTLQSNVKNIGGASAVPGGSFENEIAFQRLYGAVVSTRSRNGSRSFRMPRNLGSAASNVYSEFGNVPAAGARTYYVEGWVQPESAIAAGAVAVGVNGVRVGAANSYKSSPNIAAASLSTTEWTKVSGYVTTDADCVAIRSYIWMSSAVPTDAVIYYDDVVAIDVTEGRAADVKSDANAMAVQGLTNRVTVTEGAITSHGASLTSLQNSIAGKADASALASLQSTVSSQGASLTSHGSSITSLTNSIGALEGAGDNLLKASNVEMVRPAGAYFFGSYGFTEPLEVGVKYTLVACITHTPAAGDSTSSVGVWLNGSPGINSALVRNGTRVIATATFVRTEVGLGTNVSFYYYPNTVTSGAATVHWACLYKGAVVPPKSWQPSVAELTSAVDANASATSALTTRVTSAEGLISGHTSQITSLTTRVGTAETAIVTERNARTDGQTALSTQLNTVQATAAGNTSAIQQNATAQAGVNGYVAAQYSMKVQVASNGKTAVGGIAIQGTSAGTAGPTIDIGVMANTFWVGAPAGSGLTSPNLFIVRTAATTINGQAVPAGVYFQDAFIGNGTITTAKIGKLQVDDGHIVSLSVAKLVAGSLAVGQYIQSTSYVAGSAGWRINANGTAEFSGVVVRGTIYATAGTIGGFNIGSNYFRSTNYIAGSRGVNLTAAGDLEARNSDNTRIFHLGATGTNPVLMLAGLTILANGSATFSGQLSGATGSFSGALNGATGTFSGALNAATGTFSGNLNAVGGTFSGSLTAAAVNAVNTINIAGDAITVPVAVRGKVASINMATAGRVTIFGFFSAAVSLGAGAQLRLYRNGSVIYTSNLTIGSTERSGTAIAIDNPGAGVHTYEIDVSDYTGSFALLLLGTKR